MTEKKSTVPAVDQAAKLLFHLGRHSGAGKNVTEICREIGIHTSRGYSILNALMGYDIVTKNPKTKQYRLGPGLVNLARNVLDNMDIRQISEPYLQKLADKTSSTALLGLINGDKVFIVAKQEGDESIGITIRLGAAFHITHGAHGKAIFSFMSHAQQQQIIDRGKLFFQGNHKKADIKELEAEFKLCKEKGFAVDPGETNPGITALSAPLFDFNGSVNGCLILIGTFKKNKIDTFGTKIIKICRAIMEQSGVNPKMIKI